MPTLVRSARPLAATILALLAPAALTDVAVADAPAAVSATLSGSPPLVIGHRGASGYRPEHTLAAYELAARMGADFVEPDLVITRDGVLVARHENEISATTNVSDHPRFAGRRTTKTIDGTVLTGWFVEDFTLAELRTLRAKERIPALRPRNTIYDNLFLVPTLQEVIDLTRRLSVELNRTIGIYPETKHPTFMRSIGLPLEPPLVATLRANGLDRADAKVFVQSFEVTNLRELDAQLSVPIVQLLGGKTQKPFDLAGGTVTYADMATPAGQRTIAGYADGIGPSKDYIVPRDALGNSQAPTSFVADAHAAGLQTHPYTFRNENNFLPLELRSGPDLSAYGNALAEDAQFFALGVDGIFTDNPDTAVLARGPVPPPSVSQPAATPASATPTATTITKIVETTRPRKPRLGLVSGQLLFASKAAKKGIKIRYVAFDAQRVRLRLYAGEKVLTSRTMSPRAGRRGVRLRTRPGAVRRGMKVVLRATAIGEGGAVVVKRTLRVR